MSETVFDRDKRIRSAKLTMGQTFYLTTLNQFIGRNADAWPSQTTLAESMNATARAVRNWQAELESMGVISVDVGKGRSLTNRYRLNLDALPGKEEPRSGFRDEKEEPRSGVMRNDVPVNEEPRSYRKNIKDQRKEQGAALPAELDSEEFKTAWDSWTRYRREIRRKLSPSTTAKQLAQLSTFGVQKAVRSIELSITNGWRGLFDPDERKGRGGGKSDDFDRVRDIVKRVWSPDIKNVADVETAIGNGELFEAAKRTKFSVIADCRDDDRDIQQMFLKNLEQVRLTRKVTA